MNATDDEAELDAGEVLHFEDIEDRRDGESDRELIERRHGVDAAEFQEKSEYLAAVREARAEGGGDESPETTARPGTTAEQLAKRRAAGDVDADTGFKERLAEQVESVSTESHAAPSPGASSAAGEGGDDGLDELEQFTQGALSARGVQTVAAEGLGAVEYARQLGCEPSEYDEQRELSSDMRDQETQLGGR